MYKRQVKDNPSYHPGRCAKVSIDGVDVGVMGQVHPLADVYKRQAYRIFIGFAPSMIQADVRAPRRHEKRREPCIQKSRRGHTGAPAPLKRGYRGGSRPYGYCIDQTV